MKPKNEKWLGPIYDPTHVHFLSQVEGHFHNKENGPGPMSEGFIFINIFLFPIYQFKGE